MASSSSPSVPHGTDSGGPSLAENLAAKVAELLGLQLPQHLQQKSEENVTTQRAKSAATRASSNASSSESVKSSEPEEADETKKTTKRSRSSVHIEEPEPLTKRTRASGQKVTKAKGKTVQKSTPRKPSQPKGKKIKEKGAIFDNSIFVSHFAQECFFNQISKRVVLTETECILHDFPYVSSLLEGLQLVDTVTHILPPSQLLVQQFYANFPKDVGQGVRNVRVFVRGKWVDFNPGVIRSALNLPDHSEYELFDELVSLELNDLAAEITGGSLSAWPTKEGI